MMLYALASIFLDNQQQPAVCNQIAALPQDPATTELLLQVLTAHTVLLHHMLEAEQQQLPGGSRDCSSSSPSSSSNSSRQALAQHRQAPMNQSPEVVLGSSIAALQSGMMQLLPGGSQQYVGAAATHAAEVAACYRHSREQQVEAQITQARNLVFATSCSLEVTFEDVPAERQHSAIAPALQPAAVHLMLELQLVAAGLLQRQWQQGQKTAVYPVTNLVRLCCRVLELQIRAVLQTSSSDSLPLVLLQQTGPQLLQALAAPVQQLQMLLAHQQQLKDGVSGTQAMDMDNLFEALQLWTDLGSPVGEVLYMLGAAASGLAASIDPLGKLVVVCMRWLGHDKVHVPLSRLRQAQCWVICSHSDAVTGCCSCADLRPPGPLDACRRGGRQL
jgi:hypothetical protein